MFPLSLRFLVPLLLFAIAAEAKEDASIAKDAEAVPTNVETVASGGYWSRDHRDGTYRLIIEVLGFDVLYSRAFLQWITIDPEKQETIVERTVPIREIAGRWRISSQKFDRRDRQTSIVISAEQLAPPRKTTFTVTPAADYTYTISTSEK